MCRRAIHVVMPTILLISLIFGSSAIALTSKELTVPLNAQGDTIVLSSKQVRDGNALFNTACGMCHASGVTKTDANVNLSAKSLSAAVPNRYNIEGLIDYLKNPTTYDGQIEISELHPSKKSTDIFPSMKNLTNNELTAIAGYILLQTKVKGAAWADH